MDKIELLITGISGFVGSNFTAYIKDDPQFEITGSSRDESNIRHLRNQIKHTCTLADVIKEKSSFHSYIHLSGKVYDLRDKENEEDYFAANYKVTKRLMDHFSEDPKAKNFVFLSTIHVLTENPKEVLDESYVPKPFTPYGKSKFEAEQYIREHCPPGKNYYILRPSMIHGPGNKGNLNLLYNLVKSGIPYPVGAYNNSRSFVSIENLCFILKQIITRDIEPGLYHIADDEPTKTHDLVKMIAEATGRKGRLWNIPPKLLEFIASIGNRLPIFINEHRLNKLTGDFIVSNDKIKKAIGKPLPVTSREGLRRTLHSLNEEKLTS